MNTKDLLKELEGLGSERVKRQNNKQGAHENQFGVKLGDIRKVAKKAKKSNPLATCADEWRPIFISPKRDNSPPRHAPA